MIGLSSLEVHDSFFNLMGEFSNFVFKTLGNWEELENFDKIRTSTDAKKR